jgi:hypothetical protein
MKEMTDLKMREMKRVCPMDVPTALQANIIELIEEGYSEIEIKLFIKSQMEKSLQFLEQYVAL